MKLTLGFSPCPNDTFIFDALVNNKIDKHGLIFDYVIADVAELNALAFKGKLDVTKLSYHTLAYTLSHYELLHSGSALGKNCGPLLIAKSPMALKEVANCRIAIPGKYTTANFLLSLAFPEAQQKEVFLFSEIEEAVINGQADVGLIIHENRFTYQQKGLVKIMDLGEYWETSMQLPIPLGGIAIKRNLESKIKQTVNQLIRQSVEHAFADPKATVPYVRQYAQAMEEKVMVQHIGLYVNDFSVDLGEIGRAAVEKLLGVAAEKGVIPKITHNIFL